MIELTDAAWAAGIIDGEGCISVGRNRTNGSGVGWRYHVRLNVTNTSRGMLLQLRNLFGGTAGMDTELRTRAGKPLWAWNLSGQRAQEVLGVLYPYLRAKQAQAQVAIFCPVGSHNRYRSYTVPLSQAICYLAMRRLNS